MKINDGFVLREVAGTWVVLPLTKGFSDFNGMITLNESGYLLWKKLESGADREALIALLTEEYEVTADVASRDVDKFLSKIGEAGCVDMQ